MRPISGNDTLKRLLDGFHDEDTVEVATVKYDDIENDISSRLGIAGVPMRLRKATLDQYQADTPEQDAVIKKMREYCELFVPRKPSPPASVLMYGSPGTGKTHIACAIMRAICLNFTVKYTTVSDLARCVRSTYHRQAVETEKDVLAAHVRPALLVLDEIGVGLGTAHEHAMLHDVVSGRYDAMKPTILISNLKLDDIKTAIGDRLVDRMREDSGLILPMVWGSHRGSAK